MLTSFALAVTIGLTGCGIQSNNDVIEPYTEPFSASVSASDVNDMNIILNDSDCGNTFFTDVVDTLKADGLNVTTTKDCVDINRDNCTVITLDQQYSAGEGTLIFAPYNNTRLGHSDSLAIAMQTAFDQNGFLVDNILCSQVGYEMDDDGNVFLSTPTDTEKAIDADKDASFVTISFGTQNTNAEWVAKSIENGLARQKYYLENYDSQTDLIYRASAGDSASTVSEYFGASEYSLKVYNGITSNELADSEVVVNPSVSEYDVFNRNSVFDIDGNKTKAY